MEKTFINNTVNKLRNFKLPKIGLSGLFSRKKPSVMVVCVNRSLTVLNIDFTRGSKITAFKTIELPVDKKEPAILEALGNFIKENNISHKDVILAPHLGSAMIKHLQLPAMPEKEILSSLRLQIKEDLNFDLNRATIDFRVIGKKSREDGSQIIDIICAAADYDEIKAQVLLLKQLGLTCVSVNLLAFGYAGLAEKYLRKGNEESIAVLQFNEDSCSIAVYKIGKLDFYRELPVSIAKLRDALPAEVNTESESNIRLGIEEINDILFSYGIPASGSAAYTDKISSGQITAFLRPVLERLIQEIKRSFVYYTSQFQGAAIKRIVVAGKAVTIPGLGEFLSAELALDVSALSLDAVDPVALQASHWENAICFGLGLGFENNINLLPLEFRTEKIEMLEKVSLRWVFFFAFLLLAVSYIFAAVDIGIHRKRLNNQLVYLSVLSQVKEIKVKIDEYHRFILSVRESDAPAGEILKKLSNAAPAELFFDGLSLNCDSQTGTIMGFINGASNDPDIVLSKFINAMNTSPYFNDISISSVEKSGLEGAAVTKFQVNFTLN